VAWIARDGILSMTGQPELRDREANSADFRVERPPDGCMLTGQLA
jgi:hypothetical protein